MAVARKRLVVAAGILVGLPVLLALLLLAFVGIVQVGPGERWLARAIGDLASDPVDRIAVSGLEVSWPLDLRADRITIADPQGEWLVLRGVTLAWHPLRLFTGLFAADRLAIGSAEMLRRPAPTKTKSDPFKLPTLPLAIAIDRVAAAIAISDRVVGETVALSAAGSVTLRPDVLDVALNIRRQGADGHQGRLRLDYGRGSGVLAVDVALDRPLTGLLAELADMRQAVPAMDLKITGKGPLSDWRGTILGDIGAQICLEGDMRLEKRHGIDVLLDLAAVPSCIPDPRLDTLFAGMPITLRTRFTVEDGAITRIAEARLRSLPVSASVSGTLVERLGLRFAVEIADLEKLAAVLDTQASGPLQASGTVTGSLAAPIIEATANSAAGAVADAAWSDLTATLRVRPLPDGGWQAGGTGRVLPASAPIEGLPAGPVTWSAGLTFDPAHDLYRLNTIRVNGLSASLSVSGMVAGDGRVRLRGMARVADLRRLRSLAGQDLAGRATIHLAMSGTANGPNLTISARGRTAAFRSGLAEADGLLGPAPSLSAAAVVSGRHVPLLRLTLDGEKADLVASGKLSPGLMLGWRLDLPDLAALPVEDLAGAATASGIITGDLAAPVVGGVVGGTVVRLDRPFTLRAAIGARDLTGAPNGAFHIGLKGEDLLAEVASRFRLEGEAFALQGLELFSRDSRVTGDLTIAGDRITGAVAGRIAELAPWGALAGVAMAGGVDLEARFTHDQQQTVAARVDGAGLSFAGTQVGRLHARLDVRDPLGQPRGSLKAEAADLSTGGTPLRRVELTAQGDGTEVDFRLNATGTGEHALALTTAGSLRPDGDTQTLRLAEFRLSGGGATARLAEAARIVKAPDRISLSPLRFDVAGGRIGIAGEVRGETLDLRLELARAPLALLRPYLPEQDITGTVTADARITGTTASPVVVLEATGRGVGLEGQAGETLTVTLKGRWQDQRLALDANAKGTRGTTATLEARLPLLASVTIPDDGALQGRLRAHGDLAQLTAALPITGLRLAGALEADLRLAGTLARPDLQGRASLRKGAVEVFETGTRLRDVTADLVARDARSASISLSAVDDRGKGRITGTGKATLGDTGATWDLGLTMEDFRVVNLDGAQARASGQLAFAGQGEDGALTGTVHLGPAEYHLTQGMLGGQVPVLTVREVNKPGQRAAPVAAEPDGVSTPMTIALSIQTTIERLSVRGDGLETMWRGDLVIGGTVEDPSVVGNLDAVRGTYDFIGKQFALIESKVIFDGGTGIDPRLDITAEATSNDITAQVNIDGFVSKPSISFTSIPSLPSDEIMARLLFGSSVGELSIAQQVQIARAATALSGGGSFDPVGDLRQSLGLDLLDIGVAESEAGVSPSVKVGKYLDDDTFVRVEEGLGDEEGTVAVERRLGRGLSVEAEVGREGSGGIGLNWRMDY